jgi:mRNA-degrading endonuclease RelE of RelBE toxin-antitoxin system
MSNRIEFSPAAHQAFGRLEGRDQQNLADRLVELEKSPALKLSEAVGRLKVGNVLVLYEKKGRVLIVLDVLPAGRAGV